MSDDWTETGQEIRSPSEFLEYLSRIRAEAGHMGTGLARGYWGATNGQAWVDRANGVKPPTAREIAESLDMTVTPPGTTALHATYRQSLAGLLAALEAVDKAALTAWLAHVAVLDPNRTA
ncbi:hypothetical protein ACIQVL_48815 [Streptomyces sp. NPDC090499]|uniref:hypothetical protein n=1 Tax=Streptomyces sp. NPDC090499 TaxID=3365965 RepID=UPI00381D2DC1